jgi:hypothetical protein
VHLDPDEQRRARGGQDHQVPARDIGAEAAIGDEIQLDEAQFRALYEAYFAELEAKFT